MSPRLLLSRAGHMAAYANGRGPKGRASMGRPELGMLGPPCPNVRAPAVFPRAPMALT